MELEHMDSTHHMPEVSKWLVSRKLLCALGINFHLTMISTQGTHDRITELTE
jgi:hypothetical protein